MNCAGVRRDYRSEPIVRVMKIRRVLMIAINYYPELTGIGKYTGEMGEWLVRNDFEVRVITAPPYYPAWRVAPGSGCSDNLRTGPTL